MKDTIINSIDTFLDYRDEDDQIYNDKYINIFNQYDDVTNINKKLQNDFCFSEEHVTNLLDVTENTLIIEKINKDDIKN
jgi:hypothetical protein